MATKPPIALRLHWDWARRNPASGVEPPYWVVREGPTLIAASPLMPVKVSIGGTEVAGTWSSDPLVVAERQRQGLGGSLLRAWDRGTGVALGAALSNATRGRLDEMRWPKAQPLPCLVKPISRRAFRIPTWPVAINRLVSAVACRWCGSSRAASHSRKKWRSSGDLMPGPIGCGRNWPGASRWRCAATRVT